MPAYVVCVLVVQVLDLCGRSQVCVGSVCLSSRSILTWIGFNEDHMLFIMDSNGVIHGLSKVKGRGKFGS